LSGPAELLVIQDSGLGFRSCETGWPEALNEQSAGTEPRDIILKLGQYNDSQENPLLDRIMALGLADHTTVLTTLSDLRSCAVKIGLSLSWERLLEEVVDAVLSPNCPFVDAVGNAIKYKQVIVTIGASGAVIVGKEKSTLIFDRNGQEGDFASHFPGQMMGYNTCLLAALAAAWATHPEEIDWIQASCIGIELARQLHIQGYEVIAHDQDKHLQFPNKALASAYQALISSRKEASPPSCQPRRSDLGFFTDQNERLIHMLDRDHWTILENSFLKGQPQDDALQDPRSLNAVNECARSIVSQGPMEALLNVPVETIGSWCSADRQEIEEYAA
jgi:hypothetical protein